MNMLKRTEKIKIENGDHYGKLFSQSKETLEELLIRLGVKKCISRPCTPENEPSKVVWPTLNGQ